MSSTNENDDSKASSSHLKKNDVVPPMISKIDLQNKELIRAMENLPSTHQFLSNLSSSSSDPSSSLIKMIPDLIQIHRIVHELLPKPNKGLWEPQFNLDPFLLNYMALFYQQQQKQNHDRSIHEDANQYTHNEINHEQLPQRLSKL